MCRILLSCVACPAVPYVSILSHQRYDFRKEIMEHKMCIFYRHILFETFLILRKIQRDIVINVETSSCKVPVILVGF